MRTGLRWTAVLMLLGAATAASAESLPLDYFFKPSRYSSVQLSPDGTHLAAIAPFRDHRNIAVINLETFESRFVTSVTDDEVNGFNWANDDRLLFYMDADGNESFGIFAVDKDGST